MNKFSNYKISFPLPHITKVAKIICMYVANIVPISSLAVCDSENMVFCKFSETPKSAGETTMKIVMALRD